MNDTGLTRHAMACFPANHYLHVKGTPTISLKHEGGLRDGNQILFERWVKMKLYRGNGFLNGPIISFDKHLPRMRVVVLPTKLMRISNKKSSFGRGYLLLLLLLL